MEGWAGGSRRPGAALGTAICPGPKGRPRSAKAGGAFGRRSGPGRAEPGPQKLSGETLDAFYLKAWGAPAPRAGNPSSPAARAKCSQTENTGRGAGSSDSGRDRRDGER